jgi:hypothetical protein
VVEPLYANPSDFNFGIVRTGTVARVGVRLVSANNQTFQVESWNCPDGVRLAPLPGGPQYEVSFPVGDGNQTVEITCIARLSSGERVKVPVRLRAYGSN